MRGGLGLRRNSTVLLNKRAMVLHRTSGTPGATTFKRTEPGNYVVESNEAGAGLGLGLEDRGLHPAG